MNSYNPDNWPDPCDVNPNDPQCYTAELGGVDARQEYIHGVQDWDFDQTGPQNWIAEAIMQDVANTDPVKQRFRGHPVRERLDNGVADIGVSSTVAQITPAIQLQTTETAQVDQIAEINQTATPVSTMSWNGATYSTGTNMQMTQTLTQSGTGGSVGAPSNHTMIVLIFIIIIALAILAALPSPKYTALHPVHVHKN